MDSQINYLKRWAGDNKCYLELEGEVGFGRECVGIIHGSEYPMYTGGYLVEGDRWRTEEAYPPSSVTDAYHKADCLCVLGRGADAIRQLYDWVKNLEANGVVVTVVPRSSDSVADLLFHGTSEARLVVA